MKTPEVNLIKCIRVEYDEKYFGGDYKNVGEFILIPFSLIDMIKNPSGKAVMDDEKALGIAFEKMTGLDCKNIIHFTFDEPVDQFGNPFEEISTEFEVVTEPLTGEEVKKKLVNDRLKLVIQVDLNTLLDLTLEGFNDFCEELILEDGILSDIGYEVVGAKDGMVLVEVDAEVVFTDDE